MRALHGSILLILFPILAWTQSVNSALSGSVTDASGAVVPGVRVKIVSVESGIQWDTTTNEAGLYRVGALVPGGYWIETAAEGFDTLNRGPITLQVGQSLAIDLTL